MKLAVVSDSHHAVEELRKVFDYLKRENISHLAHAGDFISSGVTAVFQNNPEIKSFVARGNCDWHGNVMTEMRRLNNVVIDNAVFFELEGIQFGVSHIEGVAQKMAKGNKVDVFIHGHTHQAKIEKTGGKLILNPGSLMEGAGFMLVDLPSLKVDRVFNFK